MEIEGTEDWQHCPVCGSDRINGHTVEVDGTAAWQPVSCDNCGSDWNEVYEAVGRDNINTGPGRERLCSTVVKVIGEASDNDTLAGRVVGALSVTDGILRVVVVKS